MEDVHILLFYKYVEFENPDKFRKNHLEFCGKLGVLGRILVSDEGINGSISGTKEQVEKYKSELKKIPGLSDIVFKEDVGKAHPFTKMRILIKNEIVGLRKNPSLQNTGKFLKPKEFLELYDENGNLKEGIVLVDTRNDYEYKVGHFRGAIDIGTKTFRQFPDAIKKIEDKKDKKVVVYCTGGIRCEKASALLKENGFQDVSQLEGGIITFGKEYPDTVWEGGLFVFDKRLIAPLNKKDIKPLTNCEVCGIPCDLYKNCRSVACDKLVVECVPCQEKLNGCCSEKCFKDFKEQCREKALRNQDRRMIKKAFIFNSSEQ